MNLWLYVNNYSRLLRGHRETCPFFGRFGGRDAEPAGKWMGPFESKHQLSAAAEQIPLPFRWCKTCEAVFDKSELADLDRSIDQARAAYTAALFATGDRGGRMGRAEPEQRSADLMKVLRVYLSFVRRHARMAGEGQSTEGSTSAASGS